MDRVQTFTVFRAGRYCPSLDLALTSARDAHLMLLGSGLHSDRGGRINCAMERIGTGALALNRFLGSQIAKVR